MRDEAENAFDPGAIALQLGQALDDRQIEYALGGAIALGFWAQPRGTVDVDVTVFLPQNKPSEVVSHLQQIGCTIFAKTAIPSILEHGYCRATFAECPIDVFVCASPFYEKAKSRRKRVYLGNVEVSVVDAETLVVFKMMFFRPQDLVDIRKLLQIQGSKLDRLWIRNQLLDIGGPLDPRIAQWDELVNEIQP